MRSGNVSGSNHFVAIVGTKMSILIEFLDKNGLHNVRAWGPTDTPGVTCTYGTGMGAIHEYEGYPLVPVATYMSLKLRFDFVTPTIFDLTH